jgi:hypothetical protein
MNIYERAARLVGLGIAAEVVLVIAAVAASALRYPQAATRAPESTAILLAVMASLLCGYGFAARAATRKHAPRAAIAITTGGLFGVAVGVCWIIEILAGNVFGNHPLSDTLYEIALLGVIAASGLAGAVAAARSGRFADGAAAGLWSGLVSGTVPMLTLVAITLLLPVTVSTDPQNIADAARSGAPSVLIFAVGDNIVGGTNHLWIGPLLGLALGALGAAARLGISRHRSA